MPLTKAGGPPQDAVHGKAVTVPELQRITTRYSMEQDRIFLAGEVSNGGHVALCMTQRIFLRLLPALLGWLERNGSATASVQPAQAMYAEAVQGFAQQAAVAQLTQLPPQVPVNVDAGSPEHLVRSIQIDQSPDVVRLVFMGAKGPVAALQLQAQPLRQWLSIIYSAWASAGWPQSLWPDWMQASQAAPAVPPHVQVH